MTSQLPSWVHPLTSHPSYGVLYESNGLRRDSFGRQLQEPQQQQQQQGANMAPTNLPYHDVEEMWDSKWWVCVCMFG